MGDIRRASQLKRALSQRETTVSELINEIESEEEEFHEPPTPILGNSPVLEPADNPNFVPSPQDWYSSGSENNLPVNPREVRNDSHESEDENLSEQSEQFEGVSSEGSRYSPHQAPTKMYCATSLHLVAMPLHHLYTRHCCIVDEIDINFKMICAPLELQEKNLYLLKF